MHVKNPTFMYHYFSTIEVIPLFNIYIYFFYKSGFPNTDRMCFLASMVEERLGAEFLCDGRGCGWSYRWMRVWVSQVWEELTG